MQDLLNEDEFIKKPYNPWKTFYWFYGIAVVQYILCYLVIGPVYTFVYPLALFVPLITALTMSYWGKNKLLPLSTLALANLLLMGTYFICGLMLMFYFNRFSNLKTYFSVLILPFLFLAGNFVFSIGIIAIVRQPRAR